jgi:hypothetical protein
MNFELGSVSFYPVTITMDNLCDGWGYRYISGPEGRSRCLYWGDYLFYVDKNYDIMAKFQVRKWTEKGAEWARTYNLDKLKNEQ